MASFTLVTLICVLTWQQSRGQQFNSSEGDNHRGPRTQFPLLTGWVFIILNSQFLYWMLSKAVRLAVLGREFGIFVESFLWFEIMQPDSICCLLLYYTTICMTLSVRFVKPVSVENQFSRYICVIFHLHLYYLSKQSILQWLYFLTIKALFIARYLSHAKLVNWYH